MEEHAGRFGRAQRHVRMVDTVEQATLARAWQRELDAGGWSVPTWPSSAGGRGLSANEARIVREEETRFAVPTGLFQVATLMVGPTLMAHGTPAQQERFLGPMRRGDHIWCQLFSEPDAGSDLASLRTRAVRDGDEWVVTGQKVWTSGAVASDWGILLARTGAASRPHQVGREASAIKLGLSTFMGRLADTAMRVLDSDGLLEGGDPGARGHDGYGRLQDMLLGQWLSRIGGGTEQIQRNLIAERALGLPRDQRTG